MTALGRREAPSWHAARRGTIALGLVLGAWTWGGATYAADVKDGGLSCVALESPLDAAALDNQSGGLGLSDGARLGAKAIQDQTAVILWDEAKRVRQPQAPPPLGQGVTIINNTAR